MEFTEQERDYIEKLCEAVLRQDAAALKTLDFFRSLSDERLEAFLAEASKMSREELIARGEGVIRVLKEVAESNGRPHSRFNC